MARNWIVVGDMTSSGGRVITGSSFADVDGKPVSRVSDKATCPRHNGVFPIVDGDSAMIVDGQPVALHGSTLACGCKVLTAQQSHVFVDAGGGGGGGGGGAGSSAATQAAAAAAIGQYLANTSNQSGAGLSDVSRSVDLRQNLAGGSEKWKQVEVLKTLCPKDKKVVDQLAQTNVEVADEVYFDDPYFDGAKWTTKRFQAGGFQDPANNRIVVLSNGSAQDAATTLYHETHHQTQPDSMQWRDKELDAYTKTEAWTIERGLPGQGGLRKKGPEGKWIPDTDAIRKLVDEEYPIKAAAPGGPVVIGRNADGSAVLSDGTARPPQKGDTYPAEQETMVGVRKIPASSWKCPGAAKQGTHVDDQKPK